MIPWKIKWAVSHVFSWKVFTGNLKTLKHPFVYYKTLFLSLLPGFPKKAVRFELRDNSCFTIHDFIGCYLYWEIFLYDCYKLQPREESQLTIIDVGAHTGLSAIRFKQSYPHAEIHCYEPFQGHFEELSSNLSLCSISGVHFYPQGVAATHKKTKLYIHGSNSGGHSIFPVDRPAGEQEVELVDLHDVLKNTSSGKIDILKLDCELAEYEIIKSIDAAMAPNIREIIFEAMTDQYNPKELTDHLESVGYETIDVDGTVFKAIFKG
ncbi:MAG: FkbM family methyltransferase [Bacteroidota bacterium]